MLCQRNGIIVAKGAKVSDMQGSAIDYAYRKTVGGRLNYAALKIIIQACFLLYHTDAAHILTRIIPRIQKTFKIKIGRGDRSGNFVHALVSAKRTTNVETMRARMMRKFKCALYRRKQGKHKKGSYKVIRGDAHNEFPVKMTVDRIAMDWLLVSEADVHISLEDDNNAHGHNQLRQMKEASGSKQEFLNKVMMAASMEWDSGGDGQNAQGDLLQAKEERQDEMFDFDSAEVDFSADAHSLGSINNDVLLAGLYMGGPTKPYSTHHAQSSQQVNAQSLGWINNDASSAGLHMGGPSNPYSLCAVFTTGERTAVAEFLSKSATENTLNSIIIDVFCTNYDRAASI